MVRIQSLVVLLGLIADPTLGQDGKAYTIKSKASFKGQKLLVEAYDHSKRTVKVVDTNGKVLKETNSKSNDNLVFRQTNLEKDPGREEVTRLNRNYEKATTTTNGNTTKLLYEGKMILIEKKGDRYLFRTERGEELTDEDAKHLRKEFNNKDQLGEAARHKLLMPGKAVRVGEEWNINTDEIENIYRIKLVSGKTRANGKLVRVYKKDACLFGVIKLHIQILPEPFGQDKISMRPSLPITYKVTIDGCIDGSSATSTITYEVNMDFEVLNQSSMKPETKLYMSIRSISVIKIVEK